MRTCNLVNSAGAVWSTPLHTVDWCVEVAPSAWVGDNEIAIRTAEVVPAVINALLYGTRPGDARINRHIFALRIEAIGGCSVNQPVAVEHWSIEKQTRQQSAVRFRTRRRHNSLRQNPLMSV